MKHLKFMNNTNVGAWERGSVDGVWWMHAINEREANLTSRQFWRDSDHVTNLRWLPSLAFLVLLKWKAKTAI